MRSIAFLSAGLLIVAASAQTEAGFVQSAQSVLSAPTPIAGYSADRTIDQSGLLTTYTSGVTDFASYIAGDPQHQRVNSPNENYLASFDDTPVNVDFDLGSVINVLQVALWNYPFSNSAGIKDFEIYTASSSSFAGATLVGSFTAADDGDGSFNSAQVFDLIDSTARYVRMRVTTTYSNNETIGFSEIAWDGSAVPEPGTLALWGLGALGACVYTRRRKRQQA